MKKIMFNDRYGLTDAVLTGRKTQTRRIVSDILSYKCEANAYIEVGCFNEDWEATRLELLLKNSQYKVGEVVAVAQRYYDFRMPNGDVTDEFYKLCCKHHVPLECLGSMEGAINKLFVRADLMPHRICFTNRRVERLQDISDEDCLAEGIQIILAGNTPYKYFYIDRSQVPPMERFFYTNPREAYASLIDKISGRGTWESNPWVLAYDFELVM